MRVDDGHEERLRLLSERVEALEDERAIRDLLDRYGWHADHAEHDAWVDLFSPQGAITLLGGAPGKDGAETLSWHGRAELAEFITAPEMHGRIEGRCMHLPALGLRIELDGADARAEGCSVVLVDGGDGPALYGAGFTRWRLRKQDGGWRIEERTRVTLGAGNA